VLFPGTGSLATNPNSDCVRVHVSERANAHILTGAVTGFARRDEIRRIIAAMFAQRLHMIQRDIARTNMMKITVTVCAMKFIA